MKYPLPPANYSFNAATKEITFNTTIPAAISNILHVTNVTRGVLYFQPQAGVAYTGTYSAPTLTLVCSTSGHSNSDDLLIVYDDGVATLPTGAATAAKQPALGTAGSASTDVITVQGIASGVAQPISGTVTANAGTNLNTSALALENGGNLASINTKLPTLGPQQPSASLATVSPSKVVVTYPAGTPTLNLDLFTNTTNGWFDVSNYNFVSMTFIGGAGITTGAITFEQTNDNTISNTAPPLPIIVSTFSSPTGSTISPGASTNYQVTAAIQSRYIRARAGIAFAGGTIAMTATFGQVAPNTPGTISSVVSLSQVSSNAITSPAINGAGAAGILPVYVSSPSTLLDYSAQNVAATSGSLATITNAVCGPCLTFDINLSAFTAGTSTGLDLYLQESPDNGTTYYDIWQVEALTAAGRARIPALPVNGRRRIRWVNRTGAATTATLTVTSMSTPAALPVQRQFFDRTSGVGSGTAVLNTSSASYDIAGCKQISVVIQAGTATAVGSFQVQMSMDGTNWYTASAATAIGATTANNTVIPITSGMTGRFLRVTCTSAGITQVINAIHIYGTN